MNMSLKINSNIRTGTKIGENDIRAYDLQEWMFQQ